MWRNRDNRSASLNLDLVPADFLDYRDKIFEYDTQGGYWLPSNAKKANKRRW